MEIPPVRCGFAVSFGGAKGGECVDRERQARWDAVNLRTASTKMLPGEYQILQRACDVEGITIYALIKQLIRSWLMEFAERHPDQAEWMILRPRRRF